MAQPIDNLRCSACGRRATQWARDVREIPSKDGINANFEAVPDSLFFGCGDHEPISRTFMLDGMTEYKESCNNHQQREQHARLLKGKVCDVCGILATRVARDHVLADCREPAGNLEGRLSTEYELVPGSERYGCEIHMDRSTIVEVSDG